MRISGIEFLLLKVCTYLLEREKFEDGRGDEKVMALGT